MKKICLFSALIFTVILLTGCGEKKLVCQYKSTDSYHGSDIVYYKFLFNKDEKVEKFIINEEISYSDKYVKDNDTSADYESMKQYCAEMETNTNINCKVVKGDNKFTIKLTYNLSKMSEDELAQYGLNDIIIQKYSELKKSQETNGFTCK